jgi:hypothetical protein
VIAQKFGRWWETLAYPTRANDVMDRRYAGVWKLSSVPPAPANNSPIFINNELKALDLFKQAQDRFVKSRRRLGVKVSIPAQFLRPRILQQRPEVCGMGRKDLLFSDFGYVQSELLHESIQFCIDFIDGMQQAPAIVVGVCSTKPLVG